MINLRNEILRKPLGLSFTEDELEREKDDILMGAFEDERFAGLLSALPDGYQNGTSPANGGTEWYAG